MVLNNENSVAVTTNRLQEGGVPALEQGMVVGQLILADALIVGNCNNQVLTYCDLLKDCSSTVNTLFCLLCGLICFYPI